MTLWVRLPYFKCHRNRTVINIPRPITGFTVSSIIHYILSLASTKWNTNFTWERILQYVKFRYTPFKIALDFIGHHNILVVVHVVSCPIQTEICMVEVDAAWCSAALGIQQCRGDIHTPWHLRENRKTKYMQCASIICCAVVTAPLWYIYVVSGRPIFRG